MWRAPHGISNALDVLKSTAGTPLLTMHIPLSKYDSGCSKNYSGCTNPYQKLLRMYQVKTYVPEEFLCVFSPAPLGECTYECTYDLVSLVGGEREAEQLSPQSI